MESIGTEKADIAVDLYPYTEKGKTFYLPKDKINLILWENEFEVDRLEKQMINRERIRNGQAPLYDLPKKSSHELALEKLDQKKRAEAREFDEYVRKQESNYIEYMVNQYMQKQGDVTLDEVSYIYKRIKANSPINLDTVPMSEKAERELRVWDYTTKINQKLDNKNLTIKDLSNICVGIKENSPVKDLEQVITPTIDDSEWKLEKQNIARKKEKKKKSKKNYFKKVALAASVVLGLILPGKAANRYESNVVKNKTIESQKNQNEKINVQPKEEENNNGNKIVINKKIVNKTLKSKIKLKDNITLRKATFHYSSTGVGPKISQSNIPCGSYSIEKLAILSHDNELIDTIDIDEKNKNMSIDDLKANIKSVYGEDVKIKMNVTGIEEGRETYPNIGWTSINKVSGTAKAYSKKR